MASSYLIDIRLHDCRDSKEIARLLSLADPPIDVNSQLANGDTPLHCYIRDNTEAAYKCLLSLLSNCDPNRLNVDAPGYMLNTPLHVAAEVNNIDGAKALITFGADIYSLNYHTETPLDITRNRNHEDLSDLLFSVGSELGYIVRQRLEMYVPLPKAPSAYDVNDESEIDWRDVSMSLDGNTDGLRSLSTSAEYNIEAWIAWKKRQKELKEAKQLERYNLFTSNPIFTSKGDRVLCLDGGGMRGLIQIEILSHIVEHTGRNIQELFDWIVGTSTGGIVALSLAYVNKDLSYMRKLYFEIKEKVFGRTRFGYGCDTKALEEVLKREFGDMKMEPLPNGPKVLISSVDSSDTELRLCWFNNCFCDEFYGRPLWEVARCTSAAPLYFDPMGKYVDGGLRAHNPSLAALSVIEKFYFDASSPQKISLVLSVGCGKFPPNPIGQFNIEKYLFIDKKFVNPFNIPKICGEVKNLVEVFVHSIDNSEEATKGCESRCRAEKIAFYRFNPHFDDEIKLSETRNPVLCNMVVKARAHLVSKVTHMEEIVQSFYQIKC